MSFETCSDGHDEVCWVGGSQFSSRGEISCPVCAETAAGVELQQCIDELEEQVSRLENELEAAAARAGPREVIE